AISRVPTLPERSRIKARSSSREGREVRFMDRSVAFLGQYKRPAGYSAACVDLRGALPAGARLAAGAAGRLDEALTWRAVPGEGRFAARGRARAVGPERSARASMSATASSSVIVSGVLSVGSVALTPSWLT